MYNFPIESPLPRRKCLGDFALSKTQHTWLHDDKLVLLEETGLVDLGELISSFTWMIIDLEMYPRPGVSRLSKPGICKIQMVVTFPKTK